MRLLIATGHKLKIAGRAFDHAPVRFGRKSIKPRL